jgi:hypothetical protein
MVSRGRRLARQTLVVASLVALVITGCARAGGSQSGAQGASLRTCTTSQLTIRVAHWFVGLTHTGGYIAFANRTRTPCRLTGWPTLLGITGTGAATAARHVRSSWYGPYTVKGVPVVTVRRGQVAEAAFSGGDAPGPGQTTCPPPYRHLRITPPGNSRVVLLSAWFPPLARYLPSCVGIEVSMVVPAAALHHP